MQERPVLAKWSAGAPASHPLLHPAVPARFLDTMELILAPVNAAEPLRLSTKMKAFRTLTSDTEWLEQRAELLIGSMLARGGVPFEFGKDHPDYVLGNGGSRDRGGLSCARRPVGAAQPGLSVSGSPATSGATNTPGRSRRCRSPGGAAGC